MKKIWIGLLAVLLIASGIWWYTKQQTAEVRFQKIQERYGDRSIFPQIKDSFQRNLVALETNPQDTQALMAIGTNFYVLQEYEEALTYYQRVQQLEPDNFLAYYNAGRAYLNLKQYETAKEQYFAALRRNPDDVVVFQALDELYRYYLSDQADQMRTLYAEAITRNPDRLEFKQELDAFNAFLAHKQ